MSRPMPSVGTIALISVALAAASVAGLGKYLNLRLEDAQVFTNSIFALITGGVLAYLNMSLLRRIDRRQVGFAAVMGLLASAMMVLGGSLYSADVIAWTEAGTYGGILLLATLFFTLSAALLTCLDPVRSRLADGGQERARRRFCSGSRRWVLCLWTVIFVCWLPALLAYFPGIYAYDAIAQMWEAYLGELTAHHPVMHTALLYLCFETGRLLFGSDQAGMLMYSLIQMLVLSGAMAYCLGRMAAWRVPFLLQVGAALVFALNPLNALLAVNSTKDVIFAALFLVLACQTVDFSLDPRRCARLGNLVAYGAVIWLTCLFRNTGVYVMAAMIPLALLLFRRTGQGRRMGLTILCAVGAVLLFTGPVQSGVLGIASGDIREALCVPIQQLSRVYSQDPDAFTDEEEKLLLSLIPEENLANYNPRNADFTKNYFDSDVFRENRGDVLGLWLRMGLRRPLIYIEAYLSNSIGFWYPDMRQPDSYTGHPYVETKFKSMEHTPVVELDSKWPAAQSYYGAVADGDFTAVPVISLLFSPGAAFWLLLIALAVCLYERRYSLLPGPLLALLLWGTLTLSPIVLVRYAFPLMVSTPALAALIIGRGEEREETHD